MRHAAAPAAMVLCFTAVVGSAENLYPDWIRLKDSVALPCRIIEESDRAVSVEMAGSSGGEAVQIDKEDIDWLQKNSPSTPLRGKKPRRKAAATPASQGARP